MWFYQQPGQKIDDYWEPGKALLAEPGKFLESLFKYDKDNIPDEVIKRIQPYIDNELFTPEAIAKVSHQLHTHHFDSFVVYRERSTIARESI